MKIGKYSFDRETNHFCHCDSEWGTVFWLKAYTVESILKKNITFAIGGFENGLGVKISSPKSDKRFLIKGRKNAERM